MSPKQKDLTYIFLMIAFAGISGAVVYHATTGYYRELNSDRPQLIVTHEQIAREKASSTASQLVSKSADQSDTQLARWKTYKNEKYGFEFQYPNNLQLVDSDFGPALKIQGTEGKGMFVDGTCVYAVGFEDPSFKDYSSTVKLGSNNYSYDQVYAIGDGKKKIVFESYGLNYPKTTFYNALCSGIGFYKTDAPAFAISDEQTHAILSTFNFTK